MENLKKIISDSEDDLAELIIYSPKEEAVQANVDWLNQEVE